jgi:hypothetical protein
MKRTQIARLLALAVTMLCLFVLLPAVAGAKTTHNAPYSLPSAPAAVATSDSSGSGTSPFSKTDLMALAAGATALVAFGVGFRRISAPLE